MKASEILQQAFGIVSTAYAKGTFAKNAQGEHVAPYSPTACAFCSLGAVYRVVGDRNYRDPYSSSPGQTAARYLQRAGSSIFGRFVSVGILNDENPELIPEMFKKAIELARQDEDSGCLVKCCDYDDDNDGNCHIHSAPGVLRK